MKKLITPALLLALCAGCVSMNVEKTAVDGSRVKFKTVSLFSTSAVKGLKVDGTTKTTSNLLAITQGATDPNSESITASADALGGLIGTAVGKAAKP